MPTRTPARVVVNTPAANSPDLSQRSVDLQPRVPPVVTGIDIPAVGPAAYSERPTEASFATVDAHALAAPASAERDVKSLAAWLNQGATSDLYRARAIFRWITAHVRYDAKFLRGGDRPSGDPQDVLEMRIAVCEGYARLFDALAKEMGVRAEIVEGNSRGNGYEIGAAYPDEPDHAWNAVSINGKWGLLDCTWGAGHLNEEKEYEARFTPFFFLTSPRKLIYSHLPADSRWQLLAQEVSRAEQQMLPYITPSGLDLDVRPVTNRTAIIETDGDLRVVVEAPTGISVLARVMRGDNEMRGAAFTQQEDGLWTVHVRFPQAGRYELQLFAGAGERKSAALGYRAVATAGSREREFPTTYKSFSDHHALLQFPLEGRLAARKSQNFAIRVPDAEAVMVVNNNQWTPLASENGDRFTGTIEVASGKVVVAARFPGSANNRYDYLVEYGTE